MYLIRNESELFGFVKKNYISDLKSCEDEFSFYDCYSEEKKLDIELKCRQKHYDDLLIEKSKYDKLLDRACLFKTKPLYINSTPNGVYVFDLERCPMPNWETRDMPATSHFSNREKVKKVVGYFHIKNSLKLA